MKELTGNVLHKKELLDKRTKFGKDIAQKVKGMDDCMYREASRAYGIHPGLCGLSFRNINSLLFEINKN